MKISEYMDATAAPADPAPAKGKHIHLVWFVDRSLWHGLSAILLGMNLATNDRILLSFAGVLYILGYVVGFRNGYTGKRKLSDEAELNAERLRHTDACLGYAALTGQPFCIASCRDARKGVGRC